MLSNNFNILNNSASIRKQHWFIFMCFQSLFNLSLSLFCLFFLPYLPFLFFFFFFFWREFCSCCRQGLKQLYTIVSENQLGGTNDKCCDKCFLLHPFSKTYAKTSLSANPWFWQLIPLSTVVCQIITTACEFSYISRWFSLTSAHSDSFLHFPVRKWHVLKNFVSNLNIDSKDVFNFKEGEDNLPHFTECFISTFQTEIN